MFYLLDNSKPIILRPGGFLKWIHRLRSTATGKRFFRGAVRTSLELILLVFGFSGCVSKPKTIVFIAPELGDDMWQAAHTAAEDAARGRGFKVEWNGPARADDFEGQITLLDHAIESGSPGVVIVPDQSSALISPVQKVLSKGLPIVVVGSPLPLPSNRLLSYVLNDEEEEGRMAARRIGERLSGAGAVAILGVHPDTPGLSLRVHGFEKTLAREFPRISIVAVRPGYEDDAQVEQATREVLDAEPRLRAIFALSGTATLGAFRALRKDHKDKQVLLVGCDQQYEQLYYLSTGNIDSIIAQDTYQMGYRAIQALINEAGGKTSGSLILVKPRLITRENMYAPEFTHMLSWDWRSEP
jgi:ribose transport system substrate-binding protein